MAVTANSAISLQQKKGLPLVNQVAGWFILGKDTRVLDFTHQLTLSPAAVSSIVVAIIHGRPRDQPYLERLLVLLFAFGPAFIILSLSYEALFFATFCVTLLLWIMIECRLVPSREAAGEVRSRQAICTLLYARLTTLSQAKINGDHLRIALFFLAFLHVAFFGVGNVASISSVRYSRLKPFACKLTDHHFTVLPRACVSIDSSLCAVPHGALLKSGSAKEYSH